MNQTCHVGGGGPLGGGGGRLGGKGGCAKREGVSLRGRGSYLPPIREIYKG